MSGERRPTTTVDAARRTALAAQGFHDPAPTGRVDVRLMRRVMDRVGVIQLDSVNVLIRSHYMPFYSRIGPYDRARFRAWAHDSGELFEYWGHEASLLPAEDQPLFRPRMDGWRPWGRAQRLIDEHPDYIESVREQVARSGPLEVGDLRDPGERTGPWWGYNDGKTALEWLFARGRITATRNAHFRRLYDLPERVLPQEVLAAPTPQLDAAREELLMRAARHHGIGTANDLADYYRMPKPKSRALLEGLADEGRLERVDVRGWPKVAYRLPGTPIPRHVGATALLSPFDSLVWCRPRVERLFGFEYRIEIYVPKEDRVHGYYVLPFLMEGELVARVDLKSDRDAKALLVRSAFLEDGRDPTRVTEALADELQELAGWLGFGEVQVSLRGNLAPVLRRRM